MDVEEVLEIIQRRYFSCLNPDHRHTSREIAQHCVDKEKYRRSLKKSENHWDKNKKIELWRRWKAGETQAKLAKEFNISAGRMNQLCYQGRRWADKHEIKEAVSETIDMKNYQSAVLIDGKGNVVREFTEKDLPF